MSLLSVIRFCFPRLGSHFPFLSLILRSIRTYQVYSLILFMAGLGDIVQKAFYLGVGLASYTAEKAGSTLAELKTQAQKLADEMVERGEMTTEEARKYVDDMIKQAQQQQSIRESERSESKSREPRPIEIVVEDEESQQSETEDLDALRRQVQSLQEELSKLRRDS